MTVKEKKSFFKLPVVQALLVSLFCILLGLIIGFIVLLIIKPAGAWEAITTILKNFWNYTRTNLQLKNLGNTLVKTAPLLMCSLSVLFAYKAGLFNIGAAGQYVVGAGACLYCALAWHLPWYVCLLAALAAGALLGVISGALKAYCNVNEVISCIMLNWISLYLINMLLTNVKETTSPYTFKLSTAGEQSFLPNLGMGDALFGKNQYTGLALIIAILAAVLIWFILGKTKLGYELKATGYNRSAARYCGMKEKKNLIMTMAISGALAGTGAALLYLTGFTEWMTTQSSVPAMGFNGIAAAFLGGLNPIGAIFSSFFIQHITDGGSFMTKIGFPSQISDLISSLIIYLCGFVMFIKLTFNGFLDRHSKSTGTNVNAEPAPVQEPAPDAQTAVADNKEGGNEE
ncbi:MAG: ABC transporter permease [Clostridiales bacterium]|nr:ABC transporter permease [Clostridiales bacterium]